MSDIINSNEKISLELKEYYIMLLKDSYKYLLEGIDYINNYEIYDYWREERFPLFSSKVIKNTLGLKM